MKRVLIAFVEQGSLILPNPCFELEAYFVFCSIRALVDEYLDCFHVKSFPKHLIENELWLPFLESTTEFMHVNER